jgi:hypothetical protein
MRIKLGIYLVFFILSFSLIAIPLFAAPPIITEQKILEYISERNVDIFNALPEVKNKNIADYKAILGIYRRIFERNEQIKINKGIASKIDYNKLQEIKNLVPVNASRKFDEKEVLKYISERCPEVYKSLPNIRSKNLEEYWQLIISYYSRMQVSEVAKNTSPLTFDLMQNNKDFANQQARLFKEYLKGNVSRADVQKQLYELAYPLVSKTDSSGNALKFEIKDKLKRWDNLKKTMERR